MSPPDNTLYMGPAGAMQSYDEAAITAFNPGESWGGRVGAFGLAVAVTPAAIADKYVVNPIINAPHTINNAAIRLGERAGRMAWMNEHGADGIDVVIEGLEIVHDFSEGFTNAGLLATLGQAAGKAAVSEFTAVKPLRLEASALVESRINITPKGIARVEDHLKRIDALSEPNNAAMLNRLKSGMTSPQDVNFYMHELKESAFMRQGLDSRAAHLRTLDWQGIPYAPGYESQLYHPDVIMQFREFFNPAAHP